MRVLLFIVLTALLTLPLVPGAGAKPLLLDSQATYASACLDEDDSYERLVQICDRALKDIGASQSQRIEMMDVLGNALMELGDHARAEQVYTDILALRPTAAQAYQGLGWVFEDQEDCATAIGHFDSAIAIRPTASAMFGQAICARDLGRIDLDMAIEQMTAALSLDPNYSWGLRYLGWRLNEAERYDAALVEFSRAITLNHRDTYARRGLAVTLREMDQLDRALEEINAALQIDPDGPYLLSERSLILFYLDRNKLALDDAERVIALRPDFATGYVRKARALADLGRRGEALEGLAEAQVRFGPHGFLSYWHARLLNDDGQPDAAVTVLRAVVDADMADEFDLALLAQVQIARDDIPAARGAVDQALALAPGYDWAIFQEALILIEEGDFDAAQTRFDAAIEAGLNWGNYVTYNRHLIANGQLLRAIAMRVRYNNRPTAQD